MKKKLLLIALLSLVVMCLMSIAAFAVDVTEGELTYTLTEGETEAKNTAVIKTRENGTFTNTDIVIPAYVTYNGEKYRVSEISGWTFKNTNITTVTFDDNCRLDRIGSGVFNSCSSLTSINFGKAQITTIGGNAFAFSRSLTFVDNRLPEGFTTFEGTQHFDGCSAMTTLIFPSSFTYFNCDTRIQNTPIVNLIFEGKMTHVFLGYNKKHDYGGMTVHLTQNTLSDLNGTFVETMIYNNEPVFRNEKDATTIKTTGTLSVTLSSNNANSGGNQYKIDGVQYSRVNPAQDRLYFCKDEKVVPIVRTSVITGSWTTGYFAPYDGNALEVPAEPATNPNETYKLIPHFTEKTVIEEANCIHGAGSVTYCYCGYIISSSTDDQVGPHSYEDDKDCTTATVCLLCKETLVEAKVHSYKNVFVGGIVTAGTRDSECTNDGCEFAEHVEITQIFTFLGYSTKLSNEEVGITFGYMIDKDALASYEMYAGKVEFGTIATFKAKLGDNAPIVDGEIATIEGCNAIIPKLRDTVVNKGVSKVDFILRGVAEQWNSTNANLGNVKVSEAPIILAGYIIAENNVTYFNSSTADTCQGFAYSYNEISANE